MKNSLRRLARLSAAALALRLLVCIAALTAPAAGAGVLTKADLARYFPDALRIGDKDARVPVWPITKLDGPTERVVAYVFESVDLAPIPGFAGVVPNLLIALDEHGTFLEVRVLSQHEPVFLDGLGEEPLFRFVAQYQGKRLGQSFKIGASSASTRASSANVYLDGVTKATASIKIVNETVLGAALKVARTKLGYHGGRDAASVAQVREDIYEPLSWQELLARGYVAHRRLDNREVEAAFRGTVVESADADAAAHPDDVFAELWYAYLNAPEVGRNLMGEQAYARLKERLEPGQHVLWVMSRGRYGLLGDDHVRGAVPDRLSLHQDGLPIGMRDRDLDVAVHAEGAPAAAVGRAFTVYPQAGFDPGRPWTLKLHVARAKGVIWPEIVSRDFALDYALPERLFVMPEPESARAWKSVWANRAGDLLVLSIALTVLAAALAGARIWVAHRSALAACRWALLTFTLLFVGWHAQGQLSIVNLIGIVKGARLGDFSFYLYDPVTLGVGLFALATLIVWGRGTFCGWLCPFGALQDFIAWAARRARLPQARVSDRADRMLRTTKYIVLAVILGAAVMYPDRVDPLVEVEPFKTAITLAFSRDWPYVLYAAILLGLGAVWYKFYCRYLCPLGAGLAILGRLRLFDWIPRRAECGRPCGLCRHRCEYKAIDRDGSIRYADCFQCLDCVAIYHDPKRCAPVLLRDRRNRAVAPHHP